MCDVRCGSLEIVVQILYEYDCDICLSTQQMGKTLSGSTACWAAQLLFLFPSTLGDPKGQKTTKSVLDVEQFLN